MCSCRAVRGMWRGCTLRNNNFYLYSNNDHSDWSWLPIAVPVQVSLYFSPIRESCNATVELEAKLLRQNVEDFGLRPDDDVMNMRRTLYRAVWPSTAMRKWRIIFSQWQFAWQPPHLAPASVSISSHKSVLKCSGLQFGLKLLPCPGPARR